MASYSALPELSRPRDDSNGADATGPTGGIRVFGRPTRPRPAAPLSLRRGGDLCYYPPSNKVFLRGIGLIARLEPLDYDDGETSGQD